MTLTLNNKLTSSMESPALINSEIRASIFLLLCTLLLCCLGATRVVGENTAELGLLPMPASMVSGEGRLVLTDDLVAYRVVGADNGRLSSALARWQQQLRAELAIEHELLADSESDKEPILVFEIESPGESYPSIGTEESYQLTISDDLIRVQAATTVGVLRALQTLRQLAMRCEATLCFPLVDIEDKPEFPVRGVMIDVVRHWIPLADIKRQLDGMAAVKLNLLHLHFSDDQSFRVESLALPKLHELGSDGNYFTQSEIRELVEYAADRGIRVMPEFDLPGHSRSWQIAYPELSSRPGKKYHLYSTKRIFSDPIDPSKESTYEILAALVEEMTGLFPDEYFHLGGDEVSFDAWEDNPSIQDFMLEQKIPDSKSLQTYFVNRYARMIKDAGRIPVGWAEVLSENLEQGVIAHHWISSDTTPLAKRHPALVSINYYLDHMRSSESHYRNDPRHLTINNSADQTLRDNVIGVIATSWSEVVDPRNIDLCLWPRVAAISESLWSSSEYVLDANIDSLYQRLDLLSRQLEPQLSMQREQQQREWAFLAPPGSADALQALADLLEPVPFYPMRSGSTLLGLIMPEFLLDDPPDTPTELSPFTRVLAYESLSARQFNRDVERFLSDTENRELMKALQQRLLLWSELYPEMQKLAGQSEKLRDLELEKLAQVIARISDAGLIALRAHSESNVLSSGDVEHYRNLVSTYARPPFFYDFETVQGLVLDLFRPAPLRRHRIAIVPGIYQLVDALDQ